MTNDQFYEKLNESKKYLVIEFYAKWCPYCKILNNEMKDMEFSEKYEIINIDVDKEMTLAADYNIEIYPTVIIIKDKKIIKRIYGKLRKKDILNELKEII